MRHVAHRRVGTRRARRPRQAGQRPAGEGDRHPRQGRQASGRVGRAGDVDVGGLEKRPNAQDTEIIRSIVVNDSLVEVVATATIPQITSGFRESMNMQTFEQMPGSVCAHDRPRREDYPSCRAHHKLRSSDAHVEALSSSSLVYASSFSRTYSRLLCPNLITEGAKGRAE